MEMEVLFRVENSKLTWNHIEYLNLISAIKFGPGGYFKHQQLARAEEQIANLEIPKEDASAPGDPGKTVQVRLLWLRDSICILEETGRKFFKRPYALQELVRKYWELARQHKDVQDETGRTFYEDSLRRYLDLCMDDRHYEWFKKEKIDREDAVVGIVYEDEAKRKVMGILKTGPSQMKDCDVVREKIRRWFLANYDLDHLRKFDRQFMDDGTPPRPYFRSELIFAIVPVFMLFFISFLSSFECCKPFLRAPEQFSDLIVFVFGMLLLAYGFMKNEGGLPRLVGCIIAGYVAVNSDEAWSGILLPFDNPMDFAKLVVRWMLFGSFTYFYLKREIGNKINRSKTEANLERAIKEKTCGFFLRTLSYTLILGLFFSYFYSRTMLTRNEADLKTLLFDNSNEVAKLFEALPNFVGIFPDIVLSQAPMAMFIGIFINLLWEDKSLTEPL